MDLNNKENETYIKNLKERNALDNSQLVGEIS